METSPDYVPVLHPVNLNLWKVITQTPPSVLFANTKVIKGKFDSEKRKWLKFIRLIKLYRFLTEIENAINLESSDKDRFIHLSSRKLQKIIGTTFLRTCRTILENLGVLESRYEYQGSIRVLQFRLALPYRNQKQNVVAWVKGR